MSAIAAAPRTGAVRFLLSADAEPGLLPRLLQPFAKRNLIPARITAQRDGGVLHVEILLHDPEPGQAGLVAGNLGQIVGVHAIRQLWEQAPAAWSRPFGQASR